MSEARKLHDKLAPGDGGAWLVPGGINQTIILRALSLAAAVDEAGEATINELRSLYASLMLMGSHGSAMNAQNAIALLVSQAEEIKRKDAEIAGLKEERDEWKRSFNLQILSEPRAAHPKE